MRMSTSRLQALFEFLSETPHDPFTIYAIALEYVNLDPAQAVAWFERLHREHPQYVGTYYHLGRLYEATDQPQRAAALYAEGLTISQQQGDRLAQRELRAALQLLLDEDEL